MRAPWGKNRKRSFVISKSKAEIRRQVRASCQRILPGERLLAAERAVQHFSNHPLFQTGKHLACYHSVLEEFDSSPMIEAIWQAKKHCYLPVLSTQGEKTLAFVPYQYGDALQRNRYGILEPVKVTTVMPLAELDVVMTPLVAFDRKGHRLGMGAGYYDRTFAFLNDLDDANKKPKMVGLSFAIQELADLPYDPWDVLLDAVVTEKGVMVL